ncbi:MAG: hypothetical protein ACR2QM_14390 [Longimicrobiales bacterium]
MAEEDHTESAGADPRRVDPGRSALSVPAGQGLRRAMEGAVIVASILLAFGIDAAWEEREEGIIEEEILESILVDMESNQELISGYMDVADTNIDLTAGFLTATPEELASESSEDAGAFLQAIFVESTLQPVYGSLSPTNLTLVRDLPLRNELSSWLSIWEDLQETAPYQIQGSFELMDLGAELNALMSAPMMDLGGQYPAPEDALATLARDARFVNTVSRHLVVRGIALQKLARLKDSTERILDLLGGAS